MELKTSSSHSRDGPDGFDSLMPGPVVFEVSPIFDLNPEPPQELSGTGNAASLLYMETWHWRSGGACRTASCSPRKVSKVAARSLRQMQLLIQHGAHAGLVQLFGIETPSLFLDAFLRSCVSTTVAHCLH